MRSNVVLIGMPGAGKSTVGVVLAKILGMDFVDADLLIQKQQGSTLQTIINTRGIQEFIAVEDEALKTIQVNNSVISTGGSAVYSEAGMQHLKSIGRVVYLRVSFDEMQQRLGDLDERGIVFKQGENPSLKALYDERAPLYEKYAEITVDVDPLTITGVAQSIVRLLDQTTQ